MDAWSSWDEAIAHTASEFSRIQAEYGRDAVGGITSSRCTNEETWLVQKLVRAAFGNNNVDTCARVCHSPTGYGLKATLGESAGTQDFDSVMQADVIFVIGANPTDGHPVFASQMKRRLREGAKLIIADPRSIDLVRSPHVEADYPAQAEAGHQRRPAQCAWPTSLSIEGLVDDAFVALRCEPRRSRNGKPSSPMPRHSPEATEAETGVPAATMRAAARLFATGGNAAIYYGLGVTEHSQGSTAVMAHRQPRHGHRQHRPPRRRRQSAARPEQRAGFLRHGFVPARAARLPACLRFERARAPSSTTGA